MKQFEKNAFYRVFQREIKIISSEWVTILSMLILPIIAFIFVIFIFQQGVPRDMAVSVVDQDQSALSRKITQMVDATSIAKIEQHCSSKQDAYNLMRQGKNRAFLFIPKNTEKDVLRGNAPEIVLYVDNTNIVTAGLLNKGIRTAIGTLSIQIKVATSLKKGASQSQAIAQAMPIKLEDHILFNPYANYSFFLVSGLLPLLLTVFVFFTSTYSFGSELRYKTAPELLKASDNSVITAVAGKMLPYTLIYFLHALLMNYFLFTFLDMPLTGSYFLIIVSEILLIITYQLLAILFITVTSNMRLSMSLGSAFTMMSLTFAGLTFPYIGMPISAKIFSYIFPYGYWLKTLLGQTLRNEEIAYSIYPLYYILIFIVICILILPLYKKRLQNSKYHGKI